MLRLAILGMGWAGERQVQAIAELGRKVSVACAVDNDPAFLRAKAREYGIAKVFTDYRDALADPDIDAVSICLPHALHCPVAVEAAAAGKHILCEKPLALTVEDATRMIEAAEQHKVKLYVAENLCYTPIAHYLRGLVQSGEHTGELTAVTFAWGFRAPNFGYPGRRDWLTRPEKGGTGMWMLHGIHTMAQLRYIFGDVATVYMREHHARSFERPDIEGTMSGLLTMESGLHITIVQTCETRITGKLRGYTLYGERGIVRAFEDGCEVFPDAPEGSQPQFIAYPAASLSEYALEIEAFADHVSGTAIGPTTGYSERRSLAIVQAGYESAASGQPVHLKARFGAI